MAVHLGRAKDRRDVSCREAARQVCPCPAVPTKDHGQSRPLLCPRHAFLCRKKKDGEEEEDLFSPLTRNLLRPRWAGGGIWTDRCLPLLPLLLPHRGFPRPEGGRGVCAAKKMKEKLDSRAPQVSSEEDCKNPPPHLRPQLSIPRKGRYYNPKSGQLSDRHWTAWLPGARDWSCQGERVGDIEYPSLALSRLRSSVSPSRFSPTAPPLHCAPGQRPPLAIPFISVPRPSSLFHAAPNSLSKPGPNPVRRSAVGLQGAECRAGPGVPCPTPRAPPATRRRPPTWWGPSVPRRGRLCARGCSSRPGLLAVAAAAAVTTGRSKRAAISSSKVSCLR
jgi:hypothetical protein